MNPVRVTFQRESVNCSHRARGAAQWRGERDYPQTPTVLGLRTDRYSFMQYHGVWDLDELYDVQKDPHQMHNLMAEVRTTTQSGRLFNRIKDPQLKQLVSDLENRLWKILAATGGRREPTWKGV